MPLDPGIESSVSNSDYLRSPHLIAASLFRLLDSAYFLPACFALFIGLRASLILLVPLEISSDAAWYLSRASSIAAGEGYTEGGYPTAYWPVGYPGFLGVLFYLFGQSALVGQAANLLMAAGHIFFAARTDPTDFPQRSCGASGRVFACHISQQHRLHIVHINRNLLHLFTASRCIPLHRPARLDWHLFLGPGVRAGNINQTANHILPANSDCLSIHQPARKDKCQGDCREGACNLPGNTGRAGSLGYSQYPGFWPACSHLYQWRRNASDRKQSQRGRRIRRKRSPGSPA